MKKLKTLFLVLSLILLKGTLTALSAQTNDDVNRATEKIAKYIYSNTSALDYEIQKMGYQIPINLTKDQWASLSINRKIEMVYLAANNTYNTNGGEKVLALLTQSLSQDYPESVLPDPDFSKYLHWQTPEKIKFINPKIFPAKSSLSPETQKVVTKIGKYFSPGSGDLNYILTHYFSLTSEEAFEIERNSPSSEEAIKKGLSKFEDPSVQHEKIKDVVSYLNDNYESSRFDTDFLPFNGGLPENDFPDKIRSKPPPVSKTTSGDFFNPKEFFSKFVRNHYPTRISKSFSRMKIAVGGFGGVIFGSPIKKDVNLSKQLIEVNWIPSKNNSIKQQKIGNLEFKYQDGEIKIMNNILLEDATAAYNILYGKYDQYCTFKEGEGIGLASLLYSENSDNNYEYYDYNNRVKQGIVLHPAVSNLSLGRSLLYADLGYYNYSYKKIKNKYEQNLVTQLLSNFRDWKITDLPLTIYANGRQLKIRQTSKSGFAAENICFSMIKLSTSNWYSDYIYIDSTSFNDISPILIKYDYQYKRVNDFAKTFAVFRYIKKEGIKIVQLPIYEDLLIQPHFVTYDSSGIFFERPLVEGKNWKGKIDSLLVLLDTLADKLTPEIKQVIKDSIKKTANILESRDSLWNLIDDYYYRETGLKHICSSYSLEDYYHYKLNKEYQIEQDRLILSIKKMIIENKPELKAYDSLNLEEQNLSRHLKNTDSIINTNCISQYPIYKTKNEELKSIEQNYDDYKISYETYIKKTTFIKNEIDSIESICPNVGLLKKKKQEVIISILANRDAYKKLYNQTILEHPEIELINKISERLEREENALLFLLKNICSNDNHN